jgi:3D (Asp-Asp-Asp) domain-containing protein
LAFNSRIKEVLFIGLLTTLTALLIVLPGGFVEPQATGEMALKKPIEHTVKETKVEPKPPVTQTYTLTAYTADCEGCIGVTYTGVDVTNTIYHEGNRVIAVDPEVIPLGSTVAITFDDGREIVATAQDIGGGINGHEIDLLVTNEAEAYQIGRQSVEVEIITEGKR